MVQYLFLTFLFISLGSLAGAEPLGSIDSEAEQMASQCEEFGEFKEIATCLNAEIQRVMDGPIEDLFRSQLGSVLQRRGLLKFRVETLPSLYEMYPVRIPLVNSMGEDMSCIDFTNKFYFVSRDKILETARYLLSAGIFVAKFSANSLGRPFSPILQFKEVRVCEQDAERLLFLDIVENNLEIGFQFGEDTPQLAKHIWDQWNEGNAVSLTPNGIADLIFLDKPSANKLVYALLEKKWDKINPVGAVRIWIRAFAWKVALGVTDFLERGGVSQTIGLLREHLQKNEGQMNKSNILVRAEDLDTLDQNELTQKVIEKLMNPEFLGQILLKHDAAVSKACSGVELNTNVKRDLGIVGINVSNAKSVGVNVSFDSPFPEFEFFMDGEYEKEKTPCVGNTLNNELTAKFIGLNIDLVDNHGVAVDGLAQLTDALFKMPQMALLAVLNRGKSSTSLNRD